MKIAIEVTSFTKMEAGIYRYGVNLVKAMKQVEPSLEVVPSYAGPLVLESKPANPQVFESLFGTQEILPSYQFVLRGIKKRHGQLTRHPNFFEAAYRKQRLAMKDTTAKSRSAAVQWGKLKREFHRLASGVADTIRDIPYRELRRQYVDADTEVFHTPYEALPDGISSSRVLTCQTVHDIIPLLFERSHNRRFGKIMDSARRADLLIVISECTKRDLLTLEGFSEEKIHVIPLAASSVFSPSSSEQVADVRQKMGIPDGVPYFLSVSTVEPRKNFPFLLEAFKKLIQTPGTPACRLVLTGANGWGNAMADLAPLLEELKDHVHYTGFVSDEELAALYTGAEAFLFPSLYEGFGLPVLEAMACGTAVICSNTSSLPEVAGDAATLLSPHEQQPWVAAMTEALQRNDEQKKQDAMAALAHARLFSWEDTARLTLKAYEQALARKRA